MEFQKARNQPGRFDLAARLARLTRRVDLGRSGPFIVAIAQADLFPDERRQEGYTKPQPRTFKCLSLRMESSVHRWNGAAFGAGAIGCASEVIAALGARRR